MSQFQRRSASAVSILAIAVAVIVAGVHVLTVPTDIVIYATDVPAFFGAWTRVDDSSAAAGKKMKIPDVSPQGTVVGPLASPTDYFDVTFSAPANTPYRLWLRLQAEGNSKWNDSLWAQFSDALTDGAANYQINTTSALLVNLATEGNGTSLAAWGWQNTAYWLSQQTTVTFASSGTHTLRIQVREDGVQLDQIVLSPDNYLINAPGLGANDSTIVPKPGGNSAPSVTMVGPANCATLVAGTAIPVQATASDSDGTVTQVQFLANGVSIGSTASPYTISWSPAAGSYTLIARATDNGGLTRDSAPASVTVQTAPPPSDIVFYASDATRHGAWTLTGDPTAAAQQKLTTADVSPQGTVVGPLANPTDYFDVTFSAPANTSYRLWLRMQALGNSKWNDSLWVQFSDALTGGAPNYQINTTSALLVNLAADGTGNGLNAWGWQNTAYWMLQQPTTVTFSSSGTHTLRVQVREDGVQVDQIVLSQTTYSSSAPGPVAGDTTIVSKSASATDPSRIGQWCGPTTWPIVAIHTHVLPNGKVLAWSRTDNNPNSTQTYVWDPITNIFSQFLNSTTNLFCSGHAFLPDGRLLATGGHIADFEGKPDTNLFDFNSNTWSRQPDMNLGRWYPTNTTLGNGDVAVVSGQYWDGTFNPDGSHHHPFNATPQVWQTATGTWRYLTGAVANQSELDVYPRMLLASNGKVFDAAPIASTHFLDATGTGAWTPGPLSNWGYRDYGSAVMYAEGKVLITGGGAPTSTSEVIDLGPGSTPVWRWVGSMANPRRQMNATLLPDGKVLATGGSFGSEFSDATRAVFAAEMWNSDPSSEAWSTMASMQVKRVYHSTAILLPDGRVLSAGGGLPCCTPGFNDTTDHSDAEIYLPPYLFKGARPVIGAAPSTVGYGQQFVVQTADAASIAKVRWIRLPSVTHAFNENQWTNELAFTVVQGGLNVTAPAANTASLVHCPPGHYMLFIVNNDGVPSPAAIVRIQ